MQTRLLSIAFVLFASIDSCGEGIKLTPQWVTNNPGMLTLTSGSGLSGQTDYIAYLKTDKRALYEVWTNIQIITDDNRRSPWITTKCRAGAPAQAVRFGDTSFSIYNATAFGDGLKAHVRYEVYEITTNTDADGNEQWNRRLAYELDRADWFQLEQALAEQKR